MLPVALILLGGAAQAQTITKTQVTTLPIEPALHAGELSFAVLYGFLTALAFALWPLGRAHDVPVEYREYVTPLPVAIVRTLPPVRSGWQYMVVGGHVVLVDKPTWMVVDIVVKF